MIAEGPARRRIDRWRAECQKGDFEEWFAAGWDGDMFCEG